MADQPSYLGLLNDIVAAESRAHRYLEAWADATPDPVLEARLRTVALREGRARPDLRPAHQRTGLRSGSARRGRGGVAAWRSPDRRGRDHEKAEQLGVLSVAGTEKALRLFDNVFSDHSIDIRTGELLGRFIAEEYDTVRLLQGCYQVLRDRVAARRPGPADGLGRLEAKVDALGRAVEDLRQVVCARGGR